MTKAMKNPMRKTKNGISLTILFLFVAGQIFAPALASAAPVNPAGTQPGSPSQPAVPTQPVNSSNAASSPATPGATLQSQIQTAIESAGPLSPSTPESPAESPEVIKLRQVEAEIARLNTQINSPHPKVDEARRLKDESNNALANEQRHVDWIKAVIEYHSASMKVHLNLANSSRNLQQVVAHQNAHNAHLRARMDFEGQLPGAEKAWDSARTKAQADTNTYNSLYNTEIGSLEREKQALENQIPQLQQNILAAQTPSRSLSSDLVKILKLGAGARIEFVDQRTANVTGADQKTRRVNLDNELILSSTDRGENRIVQTYLEVLQRGADPGGLSSHLRRNLTIGQIRSEMTNSSEYRNLHRQAQPIVLLNRVVSRAERVAELTRFINLYNQHIDGLAKGQITPYSFASQLPILNQLSPLQRASFDLNALRNSAAQQEIREYQQRIVQAQTEFNQPQ